jgi:hypothetical protein
MKARDPMHHSQTRETAQPDTLQRLAELAREAGFHVWPTYEGLYRTSHDHAESALIAAASPDVVSALVAVARAAREANEALRWTLRNNGGECPADHLAGYIKAMKATLALTAALADLEALGAVT